MYAAGTGCRFQPPPAVRAVSFNGTALQLAAVQEEDRLPATSRLRARKQYVLPGMPMKVRNSEVPEVHAVNAPTAPVDVIGAFCTVTLATPLSRSSPPHVTG